MQPFEWGYDDDDDDDDGDDGDDDDGDDGDDDDGDDDDGDGDDDDWVSTSTPLWLAPTWNLTQLWKIKFTILTILTILCWNLARRQL